MTDTTTTTAPRGSLVATGLELYRQGPDTAEGVRRRMWREMAGAYLWGRQDAGDGVRDSGESWAFSAVYALAQMVSDGDAGPLQSVHHEWRETGRVLARTPDAVVVAVEWEESASQAVARHVPWSGPSYLSYWPGIIRTPHDREAGK